MMSSAVCRSLAAPLARRSLASLMARRFPVALHVSAPKAFSRSVASKVVKTLEAEIQHEQDQYEQPKEVKAFLKKTKFKFADAEGDVNLALEQVVDDRTVRVEWQLSAPSLPDEEEGSFGDEATEFCVTVEDKSGNSGVTFYCSTQAGEDHRFVIGNVKAWNSPEEKERASAYNGPDFEDVDEQLQEAMDDYLAEVGVNSDVCDFIDVMATDKEQREYVRWLKTSKAFLES